MNWSDHEKRRRSAIIWIFGPFVQMWQYLKECDEGKRRRTNTGLHGKLVGCKYFLRGDSWHRAQHHSDLRILKGKHRKTWKLMGFVDEMIWPSRCCLTGRRYTCSNDAAWSGCGRVKDRAWRDHHGASAGDFLKQELTVSDGTSRDDRGEKTQMRAHTLLRTAGERKVDSYILCRWLLMTGDFTGVWPVLHWNMIWLGELAGDRYAPE